MEALQDIVSVELEGEYLWLQQSSYLARREKFLLPT